MRVDGKTVKPPKGIRWDPADWRRIQQAAKRLSERDKIEMTPVGFVRMAARRMAESVLAENAA